MTVEPRQTTTFFQYLDDVGDGTGEEKMQSDYSSNHTEFRVVAQPGEVIAIYSIVHMIRVGGKLSEWGYGDSGLTLSESEGTEMFVAQKNDIGVYERIVDFTAKRSLRRHLALVDRGADILVFRGSAYDDNIFLRLDFEKTFGHPIYLRGNREGKFVWNFRSDMSSGGSAAIINQRVAAMGTKWPDRYSTPY